MAEKGENCTLTIQILDKSFQVSCPVEERAALAESARYLDEKMRGIRSSGSIIGMERIAVMAALNIAHDYLRSEQQRLLLEKGRQHRHDKLDVALTQLLPGE